MLVSGGQQQCRNTVQRRSSRKVASEHESCAQAEYLDSEGDGACQNANAAESIAPEFPATIEDAKSKTAISQVVSLVRALWESSHRVRIAMLVGGIAAVLVANMAGQIELNEWNGSFFDALQQRNLAALGHELLVFLVIIAALLAFVVGQTWMQEMLKVRLREWLTHHLLDRWLVAGR